jgi:hypothetical protein
MCDVVETREEHVLVESRLRLEDRVQLPTHLPFSRKSSSHCLFLYNALSPTDPMRTQLFVECTAINSAACPMNKTISFVFPSK